MKMKIRLLMPNDIPFITSTWLKTYRSKSTLAKKIMEGCYFAEHNALINRSLMNGVTLVACDPEDEDHVFAYLVGHHRRTADYLHYIYVKSIFRQRGIAKELLKAFKKQDALYNTHETLPRNLFSMLKANYSRVIYNPYPFFNPDFFSEVSHESR